jgi:hypothetical protein
LLAHLTRRVTRRTEGISMVINELKLK